MENTALNDTTTKDQDWKTKKGYGPIIVAVSLALLLGVAFCAGQSRGTSLAGGSGTGEMGTTTPNLVREGVSNGGAGQEDFSSTSVGDNYVKSVTNSFAENEDEGGGLLRDCLSGPCNKQRNENACLSGTFAAGCNWYPHWGAGGCSSCSGVSCGNHRAVECGYCNLYGPDPRKAFKTNDKGKNYCNGDCWWGRQKFGVGLVFPRCWPK